MCGLIWIDSGRAYKLKLPMKAEFQSNKIFSTSPHTRPVLFTELKPIGPGLGGPASICTLKKSVTECLSFRTNVYACSPGKREGGVGLSGINCSDWLKIFSWM